MYVHFWAMVKAGRPATGRTPVRSIRVPEQLWRAAKARAAERGESITEVIVRALERYVRR